MLDPPDPPELLPLGTAPYAIHASDWGPQEYESLPTLALEGFLSGEIWASPGYNHLGHLTTSARALFEAGLEKELRKHVKLLASASLGLWAIQSDGKRPAPFPLLLKLVIYASVLGSLSLSEIYAEFRARFGWCNNPHDDTWKESIRHCLSRDKSFLNIGRDLHAVGRGGRWSLSMSGYRAEGGPGYIFK
ncbi:hypothetical protein B0H13DRAFT_1943335 [Mycena leptocephala]|nr:hypothetical protein B0H13DRAFT_1943335 [Mycena leptocephala]